MDLCGSLPQRHRGKREWFYSKTKKQVFVISLKRRKSGGIVLTRPGEMVHFGFRRLTRRSVFPSFNFILPCESFILNCQRWILNFIWEFRDEKRNSAFSKNRLLDHVPGSRPAVYGADLPPLLRPVLFWPCLYRLYRIWGLCSARLFAVRSNNPACGIGCGYIPPVSYLYHEYSICL